MSMRRFRWIGMTLFCSLLFIWAAPAAAQDQAPVLVRKAFKLYKKKKYGEARLLLQAALKDDPNHTKAHLRLAETLAQLRAQGKICEHGATRSAIVRHLFSARLGKRQKRRLYRNKALKPVRDTFAYQRLIGRSPTKTRDVEKILRAVSWYGPKAADGPSSGITFAKKGRMSFWHMKDGAKQTLKGTWSVRSNLVFVKLDKPFDGTQELQGALQLTGELVLPGLPGPFTDNPHECQQEQ